MEILELLNPWWKERALTKELAPPYKRKVFSRLKQLLELRQITALTGLRRVGKSTLMYQLIEALLEKVEPERILYFSFDEKIEDLLTILEKYCELTKAEWKKESCFLFFDEIQKLQNWSNKLKLLYDSFPNLKIVISGSSSFELERELKLNLAGRHFLLYAEPLSFTEYLELKQSKIDLTRAKLWKEEIKKEFEDYLYRPFPEIINLKELALVKSYIKDNIIEKVLRADLAKSKKVNVDILTRLVDIFFDNPGSFLNYDKLAKDLSLSKKTLIQHIYYLKFTYLIREVKNFRPRERVASRKLRRIYPFHWSLQFGWTGKIDFETIVAGTLNADYYWRKGGKEIDFLIVDKQLLPIEVKASSKIDASELNTLLIFMKEFGIKEGIVAYRGEEEKLEITGLIIRKIPIWKLCLEKHLH